VGQYVCTYTSTSCEREWGKRDMYVSCERISMYRVKESGGRGGERGGGGGKK